MLNTTKKDFVRLLNTAVNTAITPELKKVAYLGMAEAAIRGVELDQNFLIDRNFVTSLVDEIGEIVILDKALFTNILVNLAKAKLSFRDRTPDVNAAANYFDFIGLSLYLSEEDLANLNKNFNLFKNAYNALSVLTQAEEPVQSELVKLNPLSL